MRPGPPVARSGSSPSSGSRALRSVMHLVSAPASPSHGSRRGFSLVVLAALCWGTSGISGRIVGHRTDLSPLDLAWHRLAVGAVVLLAGWTLTARRRTTAVRITRPVAVRLGLVT